MDRRLAVMIAAVSFVALLVAGLFVSPASARQPTPPPSPTLGTPTQFLLPYVTPFTGDIICPDSYPVGWGTVTPSSAWWLLCGSCLYNSFPVPTSTIVGSYPTPTTTPTGQSVMKAELSISGPFAGSWAPGWFSCRTDSEESLLYPPGSIDRTGTWLQCQGEVAVTSGNGWENQWVEVNLRMTDPTNDGLPVSFWGSVDYDVSGGYNTLTNEEYNWEYITLQYGQQRNAQLKFRLSGTALVYLWGEFYYGGSPVPTLGPTPTYPYPTGDRYCDVVHDGYYEDFYFGFQPLRILGTYCFQLGGSEVLGYDVPGIVVCFDIIDFGTLSVWGLSINVANVFGALTGWFLARRFL